MNLVTAALEYAAKGWAVFPLAPNSKQPAIPKKEGGKGYQDATTDPAVIRQWWGRWPNANIGLACGASKLFVIDLDTKDGKNGVGEWKRLAIAHEFECNGTRTSKTPTGGRHLLYAMPDPPINNRQGETIAPGIDARGDGGYIVAPPSVINGKPYKWEDESAPILPCPQPVVELLTRIEPEAPKDVWLIESLAIAREPRAPLVWLCDEIVAEGMLQIWFGAPKSHKSNILLELAMSVSAGTPFLQHPQKGGGYITKQAGVFWLDFDNGKRVTRERIQAFADARGLANDVPFYYVSMPPGGLDAGHGPALAELAARVMRLNVRLVVIDNLLKVSGGREENSASEMNSVTSGLRWLAETTGAAVIVIHHTRKTQAVKTRAGENLRGSVAIVGDVDATVSVERDGDIVKVTPQDVRGAPMPAFSAAYSFEHCPDTRELKAARFWQTDAPDYRAATSAIIRNKIIKALANGPLTGNKLADVVRVRRESLDAELLLVRQSGLIESNPGPRNSTLWSLVSDSQ